MGLNRMMMVGKEEPIFSPQGYTMVSHTWGNDNVGEKYGYHSRFGGSLSPNYLTYNKINYTISAVYSDMSDDGTSKIEFIGSVPFSKITANVNNRDYTFTHVKTGVFRTSQTPWAFTPRTKSFSIVAVE